MEIYEPALFSRIGLRYKSVIWRSTLELGAISWSDLLSPRIAGILASKDIDEEAIPEDIHATTINLRDNRGKVRIRHGLVKNEQGEAGYLIDNDFFLEAPKGANDAIEQLQYFNHRAGRVFRWCITERLHEAMGPSET